MPTATIQNDFICKNMHLLRSRWTNNTCCLLSTGKTIYTSVAAWMQELKEESSNLTCASCTEKVEITHQFLLPLPFIAIEFSVQQLQIDQTFSIYINNAECIYKLCGIVYYGDSHFTAHVVYRNGMIWFHDGIATGQSLLYEGTFQNFLHSLNSCRGYILYLLKIGLGSATWWPIPSKCFCCCSSCNFCVLLQFFFCILA